MTGVKIERVEKVNDKHAGKLFKQLCAANTEPKVRICCYKTQNKVLNLILPAEAASMPGKQQVDATVMSVSRQVAGC